MYALGSDNIVYIYNKIDPSVVVQTYTNYEYGNSLPFVLKSLSVDEL